MMKYLQKLGKALMLPVAVFPVVAHGECDPLYRFQSNSNWYSGSSDTWTQRGF